MASTNMDEHDYAPRRPAPPTDKHILVLLTAFEMFGPNAIFDDEVELADVCGMGVDTVYMILDELVRVGWVSYSAPFSGWLFSLEQAHTINRYYPNCLDT